MGAYLLGGLGIATVIAAILGWALNLMAVFNTVNDPVTGTFIIRCIGVIVAPIGALLGWF